MIPTTDRVLFLDAYIECAEWADEELLAYCDTETFMKDAIEDCNSFIIANEELLTEYCNRGYDLSQAGHDFWLTRQGHGAGFWDKGMEELGEQLTAIAEAYGSYCNL
jgi:hypothetical protein